MAKRDRLTPKQQLAVQSLSSGDTMTRAAVVAGVNRKTIYNWLQQERFTQALTEAGDEITLLISRRLTAISLQALNVLARLTSDEAAPPAVQLRAAEITLDRKIKYDELVDIERRLQELERGIK